MVDIDSIQWDQPDLWAASKNCYGNSPHFVRNEKCIRCELPQKWVEKVKDMAVRPGLSHEEVGKIIDTVRLYINTKKSQTQLNT